MTTSRRPLRAVVALAATVAACNAIGTTTKEHDRKSATPAADAVRIPPGADRAVLEADLRAAMRQ